MGAAAVSVGLQGDVWRNARRGLEGTSCAVRWQQAIVSCPAMWQGMAEGEASRVVTSWAAWAQRQTEAWGRSVPRSGNRRHQTRSWKRRSLAMMGILYPM